MSDIRARIEAVLRQHVCPGPRKRLSKWYGLCNGCDWTGDDHAAHVADVLAEQLGLTQELRKQLGSGVILSADADWPQATLQQRYVTPWVRADDETGGAR